MNEGRKCGGCGARVTKHEARFCDYCGAELPDVPPAEPSPKEQLADAFEALARMPGYDEILMHRPSTTAPALGYGCGAAFGVVFLVVSLVIFGGFHRVGPGFPFSLFPLIFVGAGVAIIAFSVAKGLKYSKAPLERHRARVAGERTMVSGGGNNSSASTSYYVTLEFENGRRQEFRTTGKVIGEVADGDLGVAFMKGGYLLDFYRAQI